MVYTTLSLYNFSAALNKFFQYAAFLLLDMALEEGSSPRSKERMDTMVCVNPSGLPGGGLFRDKVCEIVVRSVKTKLRHLHSSMQDLVIDKAVASLSTIGKIGDHDLISMGIEDLGFQSSYDYIGEEAKQFMKETVDTIDPFSPNRAPVTLDDKSRGLSPFTGMTSEKLTRFVIRGKKNFKRNHPS